MKGILLLAVLALLLTLGLQSGSAGARTTVLTGSIDRTYSLNQCSNFWCWNCTTTVNLDSVTIVVDTSNVNLIAVRFGPGCTGTIGTLTIVQYSSDGVKIAEGAHDLTVGGGSISCLAKYPSVHQDGIQALGGDTVEFDDLTVDCGRANESLIDANFFVSKTGAAANPPNAIVCDGCWLGPNAAHTVNLQESVASGVRNSTVCPAKFTNLTFTVGGAAVSPINSNNTFPASC